jgi:dTDP-4-dehydrorhamnose reductase
MGRTGQLARALAERASASGRSGLELVWAARPEVDLERPGAIASAIAAARPDAVINAAAYTAVDRAEAEPARALRINADAAGEAAAAAQAIGARFLQLSTDYVYDGTGREPIPETAPTCPINLYGESKLEGERQVRAAAPGALIVRTSWVVSPFGHNFVKTMLRLAGERDEVRVVDDQHGSPTEAGALADTLLAMIAHLAAEGTDAVGGLYHLSGTGTTNWAGLARHVMAASAAAGGPSARVHAIPTAEYPTPARRPAYSVLDCRVARERFGVALPRWDISIDALVRRLVSKSDA